MSSFQTIIYTLFLINTAKTNLKIYPKNRITIEVYPKDLDIAVDIPLA